jgi:excisionase family DNA binding protein
MSKEARRELIARKSDGRVYIKQMEAAELLGVTDRTIRNMVADGRLKAYTLGPHVIRLRLDEVEAALRPIGGAA